MAPSCPCPPTRPRPADQAGLSDAWLNHPVRQAVMTWMIFDEVFMPPSGTAARTSRMPLR